MIKLKFYTSFLFNGESERDQWGGEGSLCISLQEKVERKGSIKMSGANLISRAPSKRTFGKGWGEGLTHKVFGAQARGTKFNPPEP